MRSSIRVSATARSADDRGPAGGQTVITQRTRLPILVFGRRLLHHRGGLTGETHLAFSRARGNLCRADAPYGAAQQNLRATFQLPNARIFWGPRNCGRDILSRMIYGARISLLIGVVSVTIAASFGIVVGVLAGYKGGLIDTVLMRVIDVMLAFPGILLALIVVAVLGSSLTNLMIAVGVGSIPGFARLTPDRYSRSVRNRTSKLHASLAAATFASSGAISCPIWPHHSLSTERSGWLLPF